MMYLLRKIKHLLEVLIRGIAKVLIENQISQMYSIGNICLNLFGKEQGYFCIRMKVYRLPE